jgi:hypothetical protein
MKPHHVNSKQHMLSNNDILLVSAWDHSDAAEMAYKKAGSPEQITPQMLMYTIFHQLFTQPNVVRLREGNTLFTLFPEKDSALLMLFDADTPSNTVNNIVQFGKAAQKLGFRKIFGQADSPIVITLVKRAFEKFGKEGGSLKIRDKSILMEFSDV